jgi:hypothetical protein
MLKPIYKIKKYVIKNLFLERGSAILQYTDLSRSVRTKRELVPVGKTRKIKDVLDENMSVASVTAISYQLANYLDLLHNSSITVENLSETNTFIRYRNKKVRVKINANLSDNTIFLYTFQIDAYLVLFSFSSHNAIKNMF